MYTQTEVVKKNSKQNDNKKENKKTLQIVPNKISSSNDVFW